MPVNTQHDDYKRMSPKWRRCRDVADGQDAVHTAAELYLPKLQDQSPEEYRAYVMRTPFYNATWRTIAGLVGMLLRKPPQVTVPKSIDPLLEDVTLSGTPLQVFVTQVCVEALKEGRLGILVDYPTAPSDALTLADQQRLNLRPMMNAYCTESIINWRYARVNNVWTLVMVVLKEQEAVVVDEFTTKAEDRYRVLDLDGNRYRVRMFKLDNGKDVLLSTTYPMMNGKPLDFVPFTIVSPDYTSSEIEEPPLIDLVDMNLSHYRTSADLEHGAHFTGLPTPWVAGANPDDKGGKLYIGSSAAWVFPDPNAKAGFLEFTGQGLTALSNLKDSKEKQMAVLGARMLEPQKKGVESADSQSIHRKGEESMLSAAAQSISLCLERALRWFCQWAGEDVSDEEAVELELNREFYPQPMTPQMLTALVDAWQRGGISFETLFENLQAGDVTSPDATAEEEQAAIGNTPPIMQGLNVDPVTGMPAPPNKLSQQPPAKNKPAPKGKQQPAEEY